MFGQARRLTDEERAELARKERRANAILGAKVLAFVGALLGAAAVGLYQLGLAASVSDVVAIFAVVLGVYASALGFAVMARVVLRAQA